jgi:hypothetical protein
MDPKVLGHSNRADATILKIHWEEILLLCLWHQSLPPYFPEFTAIACPVEMNLSTAGSLSLLHFPIFSPLPPDPQ